MYHETAIQPLCDIKTVTVLMAMRNLKEILLLLLSSIVLVRLIPTQEVPECTNGEIQLVPRPVFHEGSIFQRGFVQYCSSGEWRMMCTRNEKWTTNEATVACRQLGYSDQGASLGRDCNHMWTGKFFRIAENCNRTENTIEECGGVVELETCSGGCSRHGWLQCGTACTDGEIRLVGSSTSFESSREGRVEVCTGGHWGTVCNESEEDIAGAVCSQLGPEFSPDATEVHEFGPGFVPISRCVVEQEEKLNCSLITDRSCDHSMDLGVVCHTYEQLYIKLQDQCSSIDPPPTGYMEEITPPSLACPECSVSTESCDCLTCVDPTPCPTLPHPTTPYPTSELVIKHHTTAILQSSSPTTSDNGGYTVTTKAELANKQPNERVEDCVSTPVLGGVIGVLVTVLVVLVIGWSLSCVALVKRKSHSQKQTQQPLALNGSSELHPNPSYGVKAQSHNYSSSGPTYELVDNIEGAGQISSVLEQHGERGEEEGTVSKTTAEDEEHYYHVLESGEPDSVTGEACDYEVPVTHNSTTKAVTK